MHEAGRAHLCLLRPALLDRREASGQTKRGPDRPAHDADGRRRAPDPAPAARHHLPLDHRRARHGRVLTVVHHRLAGAAPRRAEGGSWTDPGRLAGRDRGAHPLRVTSDVRQSHRGCGRESVAWPRVPQRHDVSRVLVGGQPRSGGVRRRRRRSCSIAAPNGTPGFATGTPPLSGFPSGSHGAAGRRWRNCIGGSPTTGSTPTTSSSYTALGARRAAAYRSCSRR